MNRPVKVLSIVGIMFFGFAAISVRDRVKADETPARRSSELVERALEHEIDGNTETRTQLLQSVLRRNSDYAPARWQSGFVKLADQWMSFEEVPVSIAYREEIAEYREIRESFPVTVEGQLKLAKWCRKKKLPAQERAHLMAVLELSPGHGRARSRLGYRRINGRWVNKQDVREARNRARQNFKNLKIWKPKLASIKKGLVARSKSKRLVAAENLRAIDDPAAIASLELLAFSSNEDAALLILEALHKMRGYEAAYALSRQAVLSPWDTVRERAVECLKARPFEQYVPLFLGEMYLPAESRANLYVGAGGRLVYEYAVLREGQDRKQLSVSETTIKRGIGRVVPGEDRRQLLKAQRLVNDNVRRRELQVAQRNEITQKTNVQLCSVLSRATGEKVEPTPQSWWTWWNDYNEVYTTGEKQVEYIRDYEVATIRATTDYYNPQASCSCLVAGTPVWTDTGLVDIDKMQIGDRVLSQNPETGELAYKPVLRTTVRPPARCLTFVAGDTAITCTGGHPFWISGKGWTLARNMKAGTHLHGVTGPVEINSMKSADKAKAYNLIVADFHTYFVGGEKVLSHDNTVRKPTNALVPGLRER